MNDLIETINYRGHEIEIYFDHDAQSPDEFQDEQVFIVYDHRQFYVEREGFDPDEIFNTIKQGKKLYKGYWVFPLYAYIHSGVALSLGRSSYPFTCNWDTSFRGFVLVERLKGFSWKENQAYKLAEIEVKTWNEYLSGDIYGYNSECGSCWGFYGEEGKKYMIEEAKAEIDYDIKMKRKEHLNTVKTWIKNKVPMYARQPVDEL